MAVVHCEAIDCKYNDDGTCNKETLWLSDSGGLPECDDYEEQH